MKRTIIVFSLLCTFLAMVIAYGYSLPVEHQTSVSKHFSKTPAEIWRVIIDFRKYAEWRENVYEVIELESSGYDAWKEVDADGHSINYQITAQKPDTQLVLETTAREESYSGSWTFDLIADDKGTTLKITETGRIYNLFYRVIVHFFTGYTSDMEAWLRSLENKFAVDKKRNPPAMVSTTVVAPAEAVSAARADAEPAETVPQKQ